MRYSMTTSIVDLQAFRRTLAALQAHVDDLDRLKAAHYQQILEHEIQVWDNVMDKVRYAMF
jgi:molybdenum cofactor biosynthesis enzyme MoaA